VIRPHPLRIAVSLVVLVAVGLAVEAASALGNGVGWLVLFLGILVTGGILFHGTDAGFTPRRH